MTDYLDTASGRRIAYNFSAGQGPAIVFLGGFMSDMDGTKAIALEDWARTQGRSFLRFDYSGHGQSSGAFEDGCIGHWFEDARAAIEELTTGKLMLVGSSIGGWISLLLARAIPQRLVGLVGIAAAPDFTEDGYWAGFSDDERAELMSKGRIMVPSDYDAPYPVTRGLIEDGRHHLVLREPLDLPFPVRLLQGTADSSVGADRPLLLINHATCPDMRLTFVKGADHSFSTPECLALITSTIQEIEALS